MNFKIKCFLMLFLMGASAPAVSAQENDDTKKVIMPWNKKKVIEKERREKNATIDSLIIQLELTKEALEKERQKNSEVPTEEKTAQEGYIGANLRKEDYTADVTDSLLNLWYLHLLAMQNKEGEEYNMDSVVFASNVPDNVYKERIAKMNSYITLPYNQTVRNYIILYSEKMPTKMSQMLGLASYYMPIFEETFNRYGLPEELKYMAVIESALNPTAYSRAGAAGMWQFIHSTGKMYGLQINSFVDERYDVVKAADAAARYLRDAYGIFGDWNLAISSYNCGAGNVNKAIRRSGSRNFWDLYDYLPRETRGYVPAFVGAMYAFNFYREHGITPKRAELPAQVDTFEIKKALHFKQISDVVGVPVETLRQLNPQYRHDIIPGNERTYILRIPYNYTAEFIENEDSVYTYKAKEFFNPTVLENIKNYGSASSDRIVYRVKSGDYLGRIASRYRVSVNDIKKWNHLRSNNISIGQKLVIYQKSNKPAPVKTEETPAAAKTQEKQTVVNETKLLQSKADSLRAVSDSLNLRLEDLIKEEGDLDDIIEKSRTSAADSLNNKSDSLQINAEQLGAASDSTETENPDSNAVKSINITDVLQQSREKAEAISQMKAIAAEADAAADAAEDAVRQAIQEQKEKEEQARIAASQPTVYTVRKGDTLYGIAKKFPGVSAKEIMDLNKVGSDIRPGMKLKIPKK